MSLNFPCESCGNKFSYKELLGHECNPSSSKSTSKYNNKNNYSSIKPKSNANNSKRQRTLADIFTSKNKVRKLSNTSAEIINIDEDNDNDDLVIVDTSMKCSRNDTVQKDLAITPKVSMNTSDKFKSLGLISWDGKPKNYSVKKVNTTSSGNTKSPSSSNTKSKVVGPFSIDARDSSKKLGLSMNLTKYENKIKDSQSDIEVNVSGNFIPSDSSKYYDGLDYLLKEKDVEIKKLKFEQRFTLSEIIAPKLLKDYLGNSRLVGKDGIITKFIYLGRLSSMIFWGDTGIGKTTLVKLILTEISKMKDAKKKFLIYHLNASSTNLKELKEIYDKFRLMRRLKKELKIILFLDETHRFTKLQQDFFLKLIENEELIFFGCTTENPSFKLNNALLSRCNIFHLDCPSVSDIESVIGKGILYINKSRILLNRLRPIILTKDARKYLAQASSSDYRTALILLELLAARYTEYLTTDESVNILKNKDLQYENEKKIVIQLDLLKDFLRKNSMKLSSVVELRDIYNGMKNSILKHNKDSALVYLAYILDHDVDPLDICNFLRDMIMESYGSPVSRDGISLLSFSNNVYFTVSKLGLPECDLSIVQLICLMCKTKVSDSSNQAVSKIKTFLKDNPNSISLKIPMHIRNAPTGLMKELGYHKGYKYNPNFTDGKVNQYYLPKGIRKKDFFGNTDSG